MSKKISQKDLEEIRELAKLKNSYLFVADSIEMRKNMKINSVLKELGYDLEKSYNVSLDNGTVKEIKEDVKKT